MVLMLKGGGSGFPVPPQLEAPFIQDGHGQQMQMHLQVCPPVQLGPQHI